MDREIIKLSEADIKPILCEWGLEDEYYWDEETDTEKPGVWDDFEFIQSDITDVDLEHGCKQMTTVVQRISDGKYFKGSYTYSYDNEWYDSKLIEVFPQEQTITVYI